MKVFTPYLLSFNCPLPESVNKSADTALFTPVIINSDVLVADAAVVHLEISLLLISSLIVVFV